jgi:TPR repeat protein
LQNILALKNPDIFFHIGEMYYGHSEDLKLVRNLNFARFFYGEAAKLGLEKAKEAVKNLDNGEFL